MRSGKRITDQGRKGVNDNQARLLRWMSWDFLGKESDQMSKSRRGEMYQVFEKFRKTSRLFRT
jgi:hypothetical protein